MPKGVRLNPQHDERTRAKIQTSQIINRLHSFIEGEVELSASQVTAALGLLKKTLPDLQSKELTITHERSVAELSDAELAVIIAEGRGNGAAETESGPDQPDSVH